MYPKKLGVEKGSTKCNKIDKSKFGLGSAGFLQTSLGVDDASTHFPLELAIWLHILYMYAWAPSSFLLPLSISCPIVQYWNWGRGRANDGRT